MISTKQNDNVLEALNAALHRAFATDDRVCLLGEDILDPYGGAFKVTRGLSTTYPSRVMTTPISEAGIVGVGIGMALRGLRPVVEIMFGDFITLAADQLVNHASKFRWMYNDQVRVPLVIRTPMGGRRGYGPTHSQTLEKLFLGVPGLQVLSPTTLGDPGELLYRVILEAEDPVLFIENKLLYLLPVLQPVDLKEFSLVSSCSMMPPLAPTYSLTIQGAPSPSLTLTAYGYMAELARQALLILAYEHEIFAELVIPTRLSPFEPDSILASVTRTGRLLTIEEGTRSLGWGSEILALCSQTLGSGLRQTYRLAARELPIPASGPLESTVLPGLEDILQAAHTFFAG
jgi:pyruvate/2-oxoglutarate/acetoin dehydrogenase E1 component